MPPRPEDAPSTREPAVRPAGRARRWLPLLLVVVAGLLYTAVWQVPGRLPRHVDRGALLVSRLESGEWIEVQDGVEIPARSRVRFAVRLDQPASVVIIGLTAERRATLYVPAAGFPPRVGPGLSTFTEQALDGVPGPELFLAELCNTPLPTATVFKAGERAVAAAGEPARVETLDLGCSEARLRVVKELAR
jgi:hypothetical protein